MNVICILKVLVFLELRTELSMGKIKICNVIMIMSKDIKSICLHAYNFTNWFKPEFSDEIGNTK